MQSRSRTLHSVSFWAGAGACLAALVLVVGSLSAAPEPAPAPQLGQLGDTSNPLTTRAGEAECPVSEPIQCGETVSGSLTLDDCTDGQSRPLDVYTFSGENGDIIDVSLEPRFFEGELEIYDPSFEDYAEVEGESPGQTVELQTTLDQTSDLWRIVVKSEDAGGLNGPYDLTLDCTGEEPPLPPGDEGFFTDPQYPDFEFRVRITAEPGSTILGVREPDCIEDTVCVSGNLPGRSEVFLRILGPRPNGFLWPTIVRFTPSRVDVEVRRISTDETQVYTLPRVLPGNEDLSGRQDRMGFPE